jgi:hypothetical protein
LSAMASLSIEKCLYHRNLDGRQMSSRIPEGGIPSLT